MTIAKQRKQRLINVGGFNYIFYLDNEQVLNWAMYERVRDYITNPNDGTKGDRDVILKGDCRVFIEAVNNLPYMQELNLGLFQQDIDQLYRDLLERIAEDRELGSYGFTE